MNQKVILTDVDGVLLDWEFAFHSWAETHGYIAKEKTNYAVHTNYGVEREVARTMVRSFNDSAAIGFLPPLRDAQYYVKLLHEKHRYKFIVISSLGIDPYARKLRERNLKKIFGENTFLEFNFLDVGDPKTEILKYASQKYEGCIWIEDKIENAEDGVNVGFNTYLMEHGHNMHYKSDTIKTVKNWEQLYHIILAEEPYERYK